MFGISGTELIIILFFGFLIFGPDKLPQMGRTVGRAIRQFRNASEAANKKFKEEVADPFQDAIAPYKDQVEQQTKPLQEDINAINDTLNETKSMFTDPFKDMFSPAKPEKPAPSGVAIPGGVAPDVPGDTKGTDPSVAAGDTKGTDPLAATPPAQGTRFTRPATDTMDTMGTDPFAGILDDDAANTTPPAQKARSARPATSDTVKKKSMASTLYGLDDDERDGE